MRAMTAAQEEAAGKEALASGATKKHRSTEKRPLSADLVARFKGMDPQIFDPDFVERLILMCEQHVRDRPAPEIVPPPEPAGSSGEAASSSLPARPEPSLPARSLSEPSPPAPAAPPAPATDAWQGARSYETGERGISDHLISLMQEHQGRITFFMLGMKNKMDAEGGLKAHNVMHAQLEHEASLLPDGLTEGNFAAVCAETLAHAGSRMINAGSRAALVTSGKAQTSLFSQTLVLTFEDDPRNVVRLARGGGGRAFTQQELEAVLNNPNLPPCTKELLKLATASTIPGWRDWSLAVTRNLPCVMEQWSVADGLTVAPVQAAVEFPRRGISGPMEVEVFRESSTVRGRLGVQHATFHVLGFSWQFCCLVVFALVRFGVVVGNPQHGGDAHTIAINRHGEVVNQQSVAGRSDCRDGRTRAELAADAGIVPPRLLPPPAAPRTACPASYAHHARPVGARDEPEPES